jgi:hypothetical protein
MAYHFQKTANKPGRPSLTVQTGKANEELRTLICEKRISMTNKARAKPDSSH